MRGCAVRRAKTPRDLSPRTLLAEVQLFAAGAPGPHVLCAWLEGASDPHKSPTAPSAAPPRGGRLPPPPRRSCRVAEPLLSAEAAGRMPQRTTARSCSARAGCPRDWCPRHSGLCGLGVAPSPMCSLQCLTSTSPGVGPATRSRQPTTAQPRSTRTGNTVCASFRCVPLRGAACRAVSSGTLARKGTHTGAHARTRTHAHTCMRIHTHARVCFRACCRWCGGAGE